MNDALVCLGFGIGFLAIASLLCITIKSDTTSRALCWGCGRKVGPNTVLCSECKGYYNEHSVPVRPY